MRYRKIRRVVDSSTESSSPNFPITSRGNGNYSSVPLQRHPSKIRDCASKRRGSVSSTDDSPTRYARCHGDGPAACCQNAATCPLLAPLRLNRVQLPSVTAVPKLTPQTPSTSAVRRRSRAVPFVGLEPAAEEREGERERRGKNPSRGARDVEKSASGSATLGHFAAGGREGKPSERQRFTSDFLTQWCRRNTEEKQAMDQRVCVCVCVRLDPERPKSTSVPSRGHHWRLRNEKTKNKQTNTGVKGGERRILCHVHGAN